MILDDSIAAVVTGGASGLGEASARTLAAEGVKVALFDLNEERGESVAADIGGTFCKVDVSSDDSVDAGFAKARAAHGQERILVNCAGIGTAEKTVSRGNPHSMDHFQKVININLIGSYRCLSRAAAGMITVDPITDDGERGMIVSTASVAAYDGQIGQAAYSSSKGGIVGMTLPAARDLSQYGIRVLAIAPGIFLTPMLENLPQDVQDSLGEQVPFPSRLGSPAEYAALVRHMCENRMLNGEVIRLDGAIRMAPR